MSRPNAASSISCRKPPLGWALRSRPSVGNHSSTDTASHGAPCTPSLISTKVAITSLSTSGSHGACSRCSTASLTEIERGPRAAVSILLFQLAHSIAVLNAVRPRMARLRWPSRVLAVARSSISRRSPWFSTSFTPIFSHHSVNGLPSTPCTHEPPRSSGAPKLSSVQVRPPSRSRASSTVTLNPESCSRRAATSPAMPAPTTITRSPLPAPIDHEPFIRVPARAAAPCR